VGGLCFPGTSEPSRSAFFSLSSDISDLFKTPNLNAHIEALNAILEEEW